MEASVIINPVRRTLQDPDKDRWADLTLLAYLFDAQLETIRLKPGAYAVRETLQLTKDEVRHAIVDGDTIKIIGVERNMGGSSGPPGSIITKTSYEALSKINRAYSKSARSQVITNYAVREEDPLRFYTSPAAQANTWVELLLNKLPDTLLTDEDSINVNPGFKVILQLFVQGWALMEDTPGSDVERGEAFLNQAYAALGFVEEKEDDRRKNQ